MSITLYDIADKYTQAFYALADSDLDNETINDTLEGLEGELVEKGKAVTAFCLNLDAEIEAAKSAEKRISARRKAMENKLDRLKEYLKQNMARCGISEIKANDGSFIARLYIGRDESVVIDDESAIPMDYKREIPASYEPEKMLIKKAIKEGFAVPGVHIEKKDRLEIK
jgi:DNA polymerase II small subunit/DNA polymerase delta subunit B